MASAKVIGFWCVDPLSFRFTATHYTNTTLRYSPILCSYKPSSIVDKSISSPLFSLESQNLSFVLILATFSNLSLHSTSSSHSLDLPHSSQNKKLKQTNVAISAVPRWIQYDTHRWDRKHHLKFHQHHTQALFPLLLPPPYDRFPLGQPRNLLRNSGTCRPPMIVRSK